MKILVFGTFDRLHPGHVYFLREAECRGELSIVVARDTTVERIKGKKPSEHEEIRKQVIERTFPHVHVILGDPERFLMPVSVVAPDLILLGYDQEFPPGVSEHDLPCPVERLPAYQPEKYKSSILRKYEEKRQ